MNLSRDKVLADLRGFIAREVLDGEDLGLDGSTPLLEYGIVNSITLISLLAFVETEYAVSIPPEALRPDNLKTLDTITEMVVGIAG